MNNKPIILDLSQETLSAFKGRVQVARILDTYAEQLKELFLIRNPRCKFDLNCKSEFGGFAMEHLRGKTMEEVGSWVYFPWNQLLVHYLSNSYHQELRTARNKNIINAAEQKRFQEFKVGVAGLSVGSHAALTMVLMGGANTMKLADPDDISGSNLNRIRYDFTSVGSKKCDMAAQIIYQMNPYAELFTYLEGVDATNMEEFLAGPPKLDVLVEEMDNLEMKVRVRLEARKLKIPVVMATDNGDNVIVDVERYDLNPDLEIFNGATGHLTLEEFQKFPPQELPRLATKIAGPKYVVSRMQSSLLEVGKTLYSWPQLGDAATLAGVAVAYVVKRLALGEEVASGKFEVNLDSVFDPNYHTVAAEEERKKARRDFFKKIGL